jgi:hypothetical protein
LCADKYWIAAGALANACLFSIASPKFQFEWLITQPYAVSMTLALTGLLLIDLFGEKRAPTAIALLLMLVAHWVNLTVCVVLVPLIVARRRPRMRALSITAAGAAGGTLFKSLSPAPRTTMNIVPASEWPHAWLELVRTTLAGIVHPYALAALASLAVLAAIRLSRVEKRDESIRAVMIACAAACSYWLVIGTFEHVQLNDYFARYVFPSVLLLAVSTTLLTVTAIRRPTAAAAIACVAFVSAAMFSYGPPSLTSVRKDMDRTIGTLTPAIRAADATVVMGDYWTVWPAVFHANADLYERTGQVGIFGLTFRSEETDRLWLAGTKTTPVVLVAPRLDESLAPLIARVGVPVTFVADRGPLRVYRAGRPPE